ncbi:uncharacterized protein LOC135558090 [Oncorhynchus masou masou]|uniref:uncharacterized protein LOC135558090 n=1 Tax=Oncorhynchus masou masou TaxID=90313 RepID=UPI003182D3AA
MVLLKTFGDTRVDLQLNEQACRATELHNEKVKKNREILKRLIDCVMFLGKQELSFRGHDESADSTNKGNYVELLSFLSESNTDLQYHLSTNKVFIGTSGKIQNDLIYAIAEVMGEEIKMEIKKAPFVAVMVDETTDQKNLNEDMGQLYTLACVTVTIPVSTASVERSFSALKRIKTHDSNTIITFADETTVVGLITDSNDETAYREVVRYVAEWCQDNNLSINVIKTNEMIVDSRN